MDRLFYGLRVSQSSALYKANEGNLKIECSESTGMCYDWYVRSALSHSSKEELREKTISL